MVLESNRQKIAKCLIGCGANVGARREQLDQAIDMLRFMPGVQLIHGPLESVTNVVCPGGGENGAVSRGEDPVEPHKLLLHEHQVFEPSTLGFRILSSMSAGRNGRSRIMGS